MGTRELNTRLDDGSAATGQFHGRTLRCYRGRHITLREIRYQGPGTLPRHSHESVLVCLLVSGQHRHRLEKDILEYAPFQAGFHPAQSVHRDEIGRSSRFFCFDLAPEFAHRIAHEYPAPPPMAAMCPPRAAMLASRLYHAFHRSDLTDLTAECLAAELLAALSATGTFSKEHRAPPWVARAIDYLHAGCGRSLTLLEVAHEVDVHPVHLSRVFRRRFGLSLGEYLNLIRVQASCRQLAHSFQPLSQVAHDGGFADQSHFCRVFKSCIGATPAEFRRAHVSNNLIYSGSLIARPRRSPTEQG